MNTPNGSDFYKSLPVLDSFFDASRAENYHPLPDDWFVAVTDIVNSTAAIENGRYKMVNILGASPIIGILNFADRDEIPFVFAGDGAAFCVPPGLLDTAKKVLADSRKVGRKEYNLDLRTAIFPLSYIRQQGHDVKVGRYRVSDAYLQAIFSGGGISYAEELLKKPGLEQFRVSPSDGIGLTDFTGLECRWQEVNQRGKEVITLLVESNSRLENSDQIYEEVMQKMREIFGFDDKTNPIVASRLSMNISVAKLWGEIKFRTFGLNWIQRLLYLLKVEYQVFLGKFLMAFNIKTSQTDWSLYKPDLALNSDHRKFDDMLRIVLSGSPIQRQKLEEFLQQKFEESSLAYGLHVTDAVMITCMVFQYQREHVHFVDGKGGGYVKASKGLKRRLHELKGRGLEV